MTNTSVINKGKKSTKKKQKSLTNLNIGSPLKSISNKQHKLHHEVLSDWAHASTGQRKLTDYYCGIISN